MSRNSAVLGEDIVIVPFQMQPWQPHANALTHRNDRGIGEIEFLQPYCVVAAPKVSYQMVHWLIRVFFLLGYALQNASRTAGNSFDANTREWTHFLFLNTLCSYSHSFRATNVSSGLATRVIFIRVFRRGSYSLLHGLDLLLMSFCTVVGDCCWVAFWVVHLVEGGSDVAWSGVEGRSEVCKIVWWGTEGDEYEQVPFRSPLARQTVLMYSAVDFPLLFVAGFKIVRCRETISFQGACT
jgi:hypothetical protein